MAGTKPKNITMSIISTGNQVEYNRTAEPITAGRLSFRCLLGVCRPLDQSSDQAQQLLMLRAVARA